MLQDDE